MKDVIGIRRIAVFLTLAAGFAAISAAGCGEAEPLVPPDAVGQPYGTGPSSAVMSHVDAERLAAFRSLWESKAVANYDVVLYHHAFDVSPEMKILTKVRDGRIASCERIDDVGTNLLMPDARDINGLFDRISATFGHSKPIPFASFDSEFGFPRQIEFQGWAEWERGKIDLLEFRVVGDTK